MRRRAISVREALAATRWAIGLMEGALNPGPATLRHHDAVIGCLREAGFPFRGGVHACSVMDSYIYGFALQEKHLPFETPDEVSEVMDVQRERVPDMDDYPYLVEMVDGDRESRIRLRDRVRVRARPHPRRARAHAALTSRPRASAAGPGPVCLCGAPQGLHCGSEGLTLHTGGHGSPSGGGGATSVNVH